MQPSSSKILRADPWTCSLAAITLALAAVELYIGSHLLLKTSGLRTGGREPAETLQVLILVALLGIVPASVCGLSRLLFVRRVLRLGERHQGVVVELEEHQGHVVAADYEYTVGGTLYRSTTRVPNPRLIRPNPLHGLEKGTPVTVIVRPRNPGSGWLADLYMEPGGLDG